MSATTQALELQEIQIRFNGILPTTLDDECCIAKNADLKQRLDPLRDGEEVNAMVLNLQT